MTEKKSNKGMIIGAVAAVLVLSCCCVTGVGGSLGYSSFQQYEAQSRMSEASFELRNLASSQESHCQINGSFVPAAGPQPLSPGGTERVMGSFTDDPGFRALGYDAYGPTYFSYSVVTLGTGWVEIRASGDVDGDGELSTHTITCMPTGCDCNDSPSSAGDTDEILRY